MNIIDTKGTYTASTDLTIRPYDAIPDYYPEDITLALGGYGPEDLRKDINTFLSSTLTRPAICKLLGVNFEDLPEKEYGTSYTQSIIILKPMADLEADAIRFAGGSI